MTRARRDADAWGVQRLWHDATGRLCELAEETVEALLDAMEADSERPAVPRPLVLRRAGPPGTADRGLGLDAPAEVVLEDGTRLAAGDALPHDLPWGHHRVEPLDGSVARPLIVAPPSCPAARGRRLSGLAVQLYALRSAGSWGIGDLADLRRLGAWAATTGAGFLLLSPLHAPLPVGAQQPSPYTPSSRRHRTPLALAVEEVAAAAGAPTSVTALAGAGRDLSRRRRIDRDAVWRVKLAALERCWASAPAGPGLDAYVAGQGDSLRLYTLHAALAERHGHSWRAWPEALRHPRGAAVAPEAGAVAGRARFHAWLQWQVDLQLAAAATALPIVNDLAVGIDPDGADAWVDQDSLAAGARTGAPPDAFNPGGQDWGLPPYDPWKLGAAGHRPLAETLRSAARHALGVRVDHVMGLFRLWWVPAGAEPGRGGYVRYPGEELLAVLALESSRAGALVVGEDLGTVEAGVRETLAGNGVLSYRLLWFEGAPPSGWPVGALGAITTHDLPTVAGLWSGADAAAEERLGRSSDPAERAALRRRAVAAGGIDDAAPADAVVRRLHAALATSPCALVSGTVDDLCLARRRPNMPGTVDEWPNWRLPLPRSVEAITGSRAVRRRAEALRRS